MKNKKIAKILFTITVITAFFAPIYQFADSRLKNKEGDGLITYGDNSVFRKVLGVKIEHYYLEPGAGWDWEWTELRTAPWMQKIGFSETIVWGKSNYGCDTCEDENSSWKEIAGVWILRLIVKLLTPGIFLISGIALLRKNKIPRENNLLIV